MSELRARVDAMRPSRAGKTRTADPRPPDKFPARGHYLAYVLFGSCGAFLLLESLLLLRGAFALAKGERAWGAFMADLSHPLYVAWHVLAFVGVVWFTLRFFRLFPKTQPPKIGPFPRPPDAFFAVALHGAFAVVTAVVALVLWGIIS